MKRKLVAGERQSEETVRYYVRIDVAGAFFLNGFEGWDDAEFTAMLQRAYPLARESWFEATVLGDDRPNELHSALAALNAMARTERQRSLHAARVAALHEAAASPAVAAVEFAKPSAAFRAAALPGHGEVWFTAATEQRRLRRKEVLDLSGFLEKPGSDSLLLDVSGMAFARRGVDGQGKPYALGVALMVGGEARATSLLREESDIVELQRVIDASLTERSFHGRHV